MGIELDNRVLTDRRKRPTQVLSRYAFYGRRQTIPRKPDSLEGYYSDRYGSDTLILVVLLVGLNVLDALFTIMILETCGEELNPIVGAVMAVHGHNFWIWKFLIVSISSIFLCLHSKFRMVKTVLMGLCAIYTGVVVYQIGLLVYQ